MADALARCVAEEKRRKESKRIRRRRLLAAVASILLLAATGGGLVATFGWDTVYAWFVPPAPPMPYGMTDIFAPVEGAEAIQIGNALYYDRVVLQRIGDGPPGAPPARVHLDPGDPRRRSAGLLYAPR